jgi:hypothetical protein
MAGMGGYAVTKYWIGVASRNHVRMGMAGGFCQLCHGKAAPMRRLIVNPVTASFNTHRASECAMAQPFRPSP